MDAFFSKRPTIRLKREFLLGQAGCRLHHNARTCYLFPVTFRLVSLCSLFSYHCDKKNPWLEQLREGLVYFSSQFQRFSPWQQEGVAEGMTHNYCGQEAGKGAGGQLQPLKPQASCSIFFSWTYLQVPVFSHTSAAMLGNKHSPQKPVADFSVQS